ncbi:MAG: CoA pyrophosphatase [Candidatus Atabeyarchaeum deiterrae]
MSHSSKALRKLTKSLKPFSEETQAVAAVALLLRDVERDLQLLVVKRVENPKDPWSGQMALPGGRRETKDGNLKETAIRETFEETGINLLDGTRFLGVLDPVKSAVRPEMKILPFIFILDYEPEIKLSLSELERYIWLTPKQLIENKGNTRFSFGTFPAYVIRNNVIWGLTYMILTRFLELLE